MMKMKRTRRRRAIRQTQRGAQGRTGMCEE